MMRQLYLFLRWIWFAVIIALILGFFANFLTEYIRHGSFTVHPEVRRWMESNWAWIIIAFSLLGVVTFTAWYRSLREVSRRSFETLSHRFLVLKQVGKLKPERDLNISQYHSFYLARRAYEADAIPPREVKAEELVAHLMKEGVPVVILGRPKQGKTRLAYQVLQKLKDVQEYYLLRPLPQQLDLDRLDFSTLSRQPVVLFLDDLNHFVQAFDPESLRHRLEESGCHCYLIATCRDGKELEIVKDRLPLFYTHLSKVILLPLTQEDGKKLAEATEVGWQPREFDGTPGSVLLDLQDMVMRFTRLDEHQKGIMRALKLLYRAGIFTYTYARLKSVMTSIFQFSELPRYQWESHLRTLVAEGFLTRSENPVEAVDTYLENVVTDYPTPEGDFSALKAVLSRLKDPVGLYDYAISQMLHRQTDEALDALDSAIKLTPDFPWASQARGVVLEIQGRWSEALTSYDDALRLKPDFPEALTGKGNVLLVLGRVIEALTSYDDALKLKPDLAYALSGKADVLLRQGKWDQALAVYEEALKLIPEFPYALEGKAAALGAQGRWTEALAADEEALRLTPNDPKAWRGKGVTLGNLGKLVDAIRAYEEAIRLNPDYPEAWRGKGLLLARLSRWSEALVSFDEALKLRPVFAEAWADKGSVFTHLLRWHEALTAFEQAIALRPEQLHTWVGKGVALAMLYKYRDALTAFEEALRLDPRNAQAWQCKGTTLAELGRWKEAVGSYEEALKLNSGEAEVWMLKAVALQKLGRPKEADDCYSKAVQLSRGRGQVPPFQ